MSNCPLCLEQVEIADRHYGALYTCPRCAGIFFVSWDGTPEVSNQESENLFSNVPNEEAPAVEYSTQDFSAAPLESSMDSNATSSSYFQENEVVSFDQPLAEVEPPAPFFQQEVGESHFSNDLPVNSMSDSSDLSDIADFGNTESRPGGISYCLEISGIDSGKLSALVVEALTDGRFGWDAKEVFKGIRGGVLEIPNLNAAKAFVLIERLQAVEVELRWRQDVFE